MATLFLRKLCLFALLLHVSWAAPAEDNESLLTFTARVVGIINSKDYAQRRDLAHSMSLPCLNGEAGDLIEERFLEQTRPPVPPSYKAEVRTLSTGWRMPVPDGYEYTLHPTHWVRLSFADGSLIKTVHLFLVHDGEQWREVWACPTSEKLRQIRASQSRFDSDCSGAPHDAALELPEPMQKWLSVRCLSIGHGLGATASAAWVHVGTQGRLGVLPAQCKGSVGENRHAHYFTRFHGIELEEGSATSAERSEDMFSNEYTQIWKLSASTNQGATLLLYFAMERADRTRMRVAVKYGPGCEFSNGDRYFVRLW